MNKKLVAVITAITVASGLTASHRDNFHPYTVVINNNSGGLLDIKKTKGLAGISNKTDLEDGESRTAMVKKRGGSLVVLAGPENSKKNYTIEMFNKMPGAHRPSVTFTDKGFTTIGFSTQDKPYKVTINNQSGGFARILDAVNATGNGLQIPPMASTIITVKPNSYIVMEMGPEKRKLTYKVTFADQTGRGNPSVTLTKRSFTSNGILTANVQVQAHRTTGIIRRPRLEAKVARKNLDTINTRKNSHNPTMIAAPKAVAPSINSNPVVNVPNKSSTARFARRTQ